jgi:hypothetical protein
MATPADQRLLELLGKWLKSLELHIRYSSLDGDSYSKIQPWPEHQRPARWIIDLAIQKVQALRTQLQERIKRGDATFSDSLELMIFLANLVGAEHIERFIPMASPENERVPPPSAPAEAQPQTAAEPAVTEPTVTSPAVTASATREMPEFVGSSRQSPPPVGTSQVARAERKPTADPAPRATPELPGKLAVPARPVAPEVPAAPEKSAAPEPVAAPERVVAPESVAAPERVAAPEPVAVPQRVAAPPQRVAAPPQRVAVPQRAAAPQRVAAPKRGGAAEKPAAPASGARPPAPGKPGAGGAGSDKAREQVIADAARLVQWGRKWFELAELIARMADRPPLAEVRRILKDNKAAIQEKAGRA